MRKSLFHKPHNMFNQRIIWWIPRSEATALTSVSRSGMTHLDWCLEWELSLHDACCIITVQKTYKGSSFLLLLSLGGCLGAPKTLTPSGPVTLAAVRDPGPRVSRSISNSTDSPSVISSWRAKSEYKKLTLGDKKVLTCQMFKYSSDFVVSSILSDGTSKIDEKWAPAKLLKPSARIPDWWTKQSGVPSSSDRNPNPLTES